jgi:hypothetical protein
VPLFIPLYFLLSGISIRLYFHVYYRQSDCLFKEKTFDIVFSPISHQAVHEIFTLFLGNAIAIAIAIGFSIQMPNKLSYS